MPSNFEAGIALAREFNAHIRELAERLSEGGECDNQEYVFLCECGCERQVLLTLAAFVAAGSAYADGDGQRD